MWALKYYVDDVKTYKNNFQNQRLILPTWHTKFMERYKKNISNKKDEHLQCVFTRNKASILRTKKI